MPKRVEIFFVKYTFKVQAISTVALVAEYTIGPLIDDDDSMLINLRETLQRIIESNTSVLAGSMTKEAIFKDAKEFLQKVFDNVQLELKQIGLQIYGVKVKQLVDDQKTQMEAADQDTYIAVNIEIEKKKEATKVPEELINGSKTGYQIAPSAAAPSTVASHIIDIDGDPVAAAAAGPTTPVAAAGPATAAGHTAAVADGHAAAAGPTTTVAPVAVGRAAAAGPIIAVAPVAVGRAAAAGPITAVAPVAVGRAAAAGPITAVVAAGPAAAAVAAGPAAPAGLTTAGPAVVAAVAVGHAAAGSAVVVAAAAAAGHATAGPAVVVAAAAGHAAIGPIIAAFATGCCIIM